MTIFFLFIAPGLIVAYALILRPMLARIPAFAKFYANANGFWAKVWAMCGNSLTILWGKIVGGVGLALAMLDPVSLALGDPGFKDQVTNALQSNPKVLGYIMIGISAITIFARIRSIGRA